MAEKYRDTFLKDAQSLDVFEDLLSDLCLYQELDLENTEELHLHNFAIRLLVKMGIYDGPNMRAVTKNLLNIPLAPPPIPDSLQPGRDMIRD